MENLKPIETVYNGYKFRSRLEARWAVFFDALGVEYEYEPEGFEIGRIKYLPDFYLPKLDYYVEVKGYNEHLQDDINKVEEFVKAVKKTTVILSTLPYSEESRGLYFFPEIYYTSRISSHVEYCYIAFEKYEDINQILVLDDFTMAQRRWRNSTWNNITRLWEALQPVCGEKFDVNEDIPGLKFRELSSYSLRPVQDAILKARQARFEHGECG